ncbi:hypothetical protein SteCoe_31381 [Stentor coeruleus]|uniref:G-protein coupled receptors family 1 profile domain-containing protein n=1 Tax=Stentor coeruleus TaxID=5963 RepID=A0A1R2B1W1_9CILI|nr:hypothetical protein SteCoe_31381 [Stentor coeruleus]
MIQYAAVSPFMALSTISSLMMIILSITNANLRQRYPFQLIFILAILDFLWSLVSLIPVELFENRVFCSLQGALNQLFNMSDLLWTAFMSFELYNVVYKDMPKLMYGYIKPLIFILIISTITALIPWTLDVYKLAGAWCWINKSKGPRKLENLLLRILLFYGVAWIVMIWNTFVSVKLYFKLKYRFSRENKSIVNKLAFYPLILFICYCPITISRIFEEAVEIPLWFHIFSECMMMIEGILNMIVYGFTDEVKVIIKQMISRKGKASQYESNGVAMNLVAK